MSTSISEAEIQDLVGKKVSLNYIATSKTFKGIQSSSLPQDIKGVLKSFDPKLSITIEQDNGSSAYVLMVPNCIYLISPI